MWLFLQVSHDKAASDDGVQFQSYVQYLHQLEFKVTLAALRTRFTSLHRALDIHRAALAAAGTAVAGKVAGKVVTGKPVAGMSGWVGHLIFGSSR